MIIFISIMIFLMWFSLGACLPLRIFTEYLIEDKGRKVRFEDIFVITFSGCCGIFGLLGSILIINKIRADDV